MTSISLRIFRLILIKLGSLLRLLPGELPRDPKKRKAKKADFEILLSLGAGPRLQLLAMGSGSKARRKKGALIDLSAIDGQAEVCQLDLTPLFNALSGSVAEINLEGACLRGDRLLLFNRGNMQSPISHILETSWADVAAGVTPNISTVAELSLPSINAVPLTVTDACGLDDGTMILTAAAEATDDSYADGALAGSAFVLLDAWFQIIRVEPIDLAIKIEGVSATRTADGIELLCVSDADDPDRPSALYSGTIHTTA